MFKVFVERKPAFDVVVDGLNVANISKDKGRQSEVVRKHTPSLFYWFVPSYVSVQPGDF